MLLRRARGCHSEHAALPSPCIREHRASSVHVASPAQGQPSAAAAQRSPSPALPQPSAPGQVSSAGRSLPPLARLSCEMSIAAGILFSQLELVHLALPSSCGGARQRVPGQAHRRGARSAPPAACGAVWASATLGWAKSSTPLSLDRAGGGRGSALPVWRSGRREKARAAASSGKPSEAEKPAALEREPAPETEARPFGSRLAAVHLALPSSCGGARQRVPGQAHRRGARCARARLWLARCGLREG